MTLMVVTVLQQNVKNLVIMIGTVQLQVLQQQVLIILILMIT